MTALLPLAGWGSARAASVYQGTLGTQAVVLKLNGPDDSHYFYARKGVDIPLSMGGSGGALSLTETPASWDAGPDGSYTRVTGRLSLTRDGNTLKGSWQSPDGRRRLPVRLSPVKVAAVPLALPASPGLLKLRAEDAATFLKLNHALLPAGRKNGLDWWREPLSGLAYPRLPGGEPGNAVLQDRQLKFAQYALDCQGQLGTKGDPGQPAWDQRTSVTYLSPRLLSLSETVSYFCGGAHPDAYTEGLMLDRASGRALKVRDLWPRLTPSALNRLYLAGYPRADAECRDALRLPGADSASDPTAYAAFLTPGGLSLWPTFLPHVVLACAETVTVPYAQLAPLAGPLAPRR